MFVQPRTWPGAARPHVGAWLAAAWLAAAAWPGTALATDTVPRSPAPPAVATGMIGGTATYRERIALTPEAIFEAVLEDVSRADAPAQVLGRTRIDAPGPVPIRFALAYDPASLRADRRYHVRATIRDGGRLAFTTDTINRPFIDGRPQPLQLVLRAVPPASPPTDGAPATVAPSPAGATRLGALPATFAGVLPCADCEGIRQTLDLFTDGAFHWRSVYLGKPAGNAPDDLGRWTFASDGRTLLLHGGREAPVRFIVRDDDALRLLDLEGRPIESSLNYELRRLPGPFTPFEPRATLRGAYAYFADAPIFTDCGTGQRMPVAPEGDALALERAYVAARQPPAAPRIALLEGRIAQRMPMEGPGPRPTLLVDRFLRLAAASEACPPPPANAPLAGTRWRLTRLDDAPVFATPGARRREAWLQFDGAAPRVSGSGGCNTLTGTYAVDADTLRVSQVAGTRMACADAVASQERRFLEMLASARRWLVAGTLLELLDDDDRLLARFEAAPPDARRR
jgi:copper homeostasis protein (lipoprotein)